MSSKKNTYTVCFREKNLSLEVEEGTTLLQAEIAAGMVPDAPCGGQGKCGKCRVMLNGKEVLACQTKIGEDCEVLPASKERKHVQILNEGLFRKVDCRPGWLPEEVEHPLLAAVDLGSTTVVVYLMDGKDGKLLSTRSALNPQRQYGADVVMRCSYVLEHGAEALSGCIREAIDKLLGEAAGEAGREKKDIVKVVLAGNTCMHHLFLELPVDTLVRAPYVPKVTAPVEK